MAAAFILAIAEATGAQAERDAFRAPCLVKRQALTKAEAEFFLQDQARDGSVSAS